MLHNVAKRKAVFTEIIKTPSSSRVTMLHIFFQTYSQRCSQNLDFSHLTELLTLYGKVAQESGLTFHLAPARLRCLLLIYAELLHIEATAVLRLSGIISQLFGEREVIGTGIQKGPLDARDMFEIMLQLAGPGIEFIVCPLEILHTSKLHYVEY